MRQRTVRTISCQEAVRLPSVSLPRARWRCHRSVGTSVSQAVVCSGLDTTAFSASTRPSPDTDVVACRRVAYLLHNSISRPCWKRFPDGGADDVGARARHSHQDSLGSERGTHPRHMPERRTGGQVLDGFSRVASTRAIKASISSKEAKCVDSPDTTCSTRPAIRPDEISVSSRNCTTKARYADKGDTSAAGGFTWSLQTVYGMVMHRVRPMAYDGASGLPWACPSLAWRNALRLQDATWTYAAAEA